MGEFMSNKKTISLAMIVKNEEKKLPVVWQSVKNMITEWIVVDTGSTDNTVEVAKKLGAEVFEVGDKFDHKLTNEDVQFIHSYIPGFDVKSGDSVFDFSAARNFSFDKCTEDFILWLDADDILVGSDHLRKMVDKYLEPDKQLGIHLLYKYESDHHGNSIVEHFRERVFPNNNTCKWVGFIHEIVIPTQETQYVRIEPVDCYVQHNIRQDHNRVSGTRNIKNLMYELRQTKDNPDPRTLFYLAEALKPFNQDKSLETFIEYTKVSGWDEERCLAAMRIADIYMLKGDLKKALDWAFECIKFRPDFPMGYATAAHAFYEIGRYADCELYAKFALDLKQPETLIMMNQKHNEFTPEFLLAHCFFKAGKVKEALPHIANALKYEPTHEELNRMKVTCIRAQEEEKIVNSFKDVYDFLKSEGELVKAGNLFECIPWCHEEDPRIVYSSREALKDLAKTIKTSKREQVSLKDIKELPDKLPHIQYLVQELKARKAKTVFLFHFENPMVMTYLKDQGFEVILQPEKNKRYDAVAAFDIIDKYASPEPLVKAMLNLIKPDGLCALSFRHGSEKVEGRVRVYTPSSMNVMLRRCKFTLWTNLTLSNGITYTSFFPGQPKKKKKSISFLCGNNHVNEWGPFSIYTGIGGSEEATIYISKELAKLGHEVTVFNENPHQCTVSGVSWRHHATLKSDEHFDVTILWRIPQWLDQYEFSSDKIIWWMHDVPQDYWFSEARKKKIDTIFVLSEYHKGLLPDDWKDKAIVTQNGVDLSQFQDEVERDPNRVIYTSAYDRGLEHLLEMWPKVREEVPKAELHIFYGWNTFDALRTDELHQRWKSKMVKLMNDLPGVFEHGRIGQIELAKEYQKANVFAYPCHFDEISCISAMKAQVAGCIPLTTDHAALAETNRTEYKITGNPKDSLTVFTAFRNKLISVLKEDNPARPDGVQGFSWTKVAKDWSEVIEK